MIKKQKINTEIIKKIDLASIFLKSLANKKRLLILCELSEGPKNVTTLIKATGINQTSMSQHLLKLKNSGIIDFKRKHRILIYRIINKDVYKIMKILHNFYCS